MRWSLIPSTPPLCGGANEIISQVILEVAEAIGLPKHNMLGWSKGRVGDCIEATMGKALERMHDGVDDRVRYNEPWKLDVRDPFEKGITYLCCLTCVLCQWTTVTNYCHGVKRLFPDLPGMLQAAAQAASTSTTRHDFLDHLHKERECAAWVVS